MSSIKPELNPDCNAICRVANSKVWVPACRSVHWGPKAILPEDTLNEGIVDLYDFYLYTQPPHDSSRLPSTISEFYAYKQRSFYDEIIAFYH